jgi:hypothetical protein
MFSEMALPGALTANASILNTGFLEASQTSQQMSSPIGKVALVIGGTRGVGAAVSIAFAHAGADVAVT